MKSKLFKGLCFLFIVLVFTVPALIACSSGTPSPAAKPAAPSSAAPAPAAPPSTALAPKSTAAAPTTTTAAPKPTAAAPTTSAAPKVEPITLRAILPFAPTITTVKFSVEFFNRVTQRSNGQLTIKHIGGVEVIPWADQAEALRSGAIDVAHVFTGTYEDKIPEAGSFQVSRLTPTEEKKSGFYDFMVTLHKAKMNSYYLGRSRTGSDYAINTNFMVNDPKQDFKGKILSVSSALYIPFANALGAKPLSMAEGDTYTALQKGMVDGAFSPSTVLKGNAYYEVVKYRIDHPIYFAANSALQVNLNAWNKLSPAMQKLMNDTMVEIEGEMTAFFADDNKANIKFATDKGVKLITFAPDVGNWYVTTAHQATWDGVKSKVTPENYAQLRKLLKEE